MELRDYQIKLSERGTEVLKTLGIVYYCMEVRTGKTLTALNTIKISGYKKALFLTKLKATKSIYKDYTDFAYDKHFELTILNNESLHKLLPEETFDIVVMDEAHRFGAYPKPSGRTKDFKAKFSKLPLIFLSGTPYPESYSQIYHQFWVSDRSPFKEHANFYKWFRNMCLVKTEFEMGFGIVANYSNNITSINKFFNFELRKISKDDPDKLTRQVEIKNLRDLSITMMELGNERVMGFIEPYMLKYTQKEAGFTATINEHIVYCKMTDKTMAMAASLKEKKVLVGKSETILGDTPVKLMTKVHQLYSGTIKFESGNSMIIDDSKAQFIKQKFNGNKIAIFYKFKEEYALLQQVYGDRVTDNLDDFNMSDKNIALQIISGREGISLSKADYIVYFNLDFSALSYWQSRDRLTTMNRPTNDVFWIFSKGGIEKQIYNSVVKKKNYTASIFMKQNGK